MWGIPLGTSYSLLEIVSPLGILLPLRNPSPGATKARMEDPNEMEAGGAPYLSLVADARRIDSG